MTVEWGKALFDRYDELMKHLNNSIDFMEFTLRMNQERIKIEFDYAKQMKRNVTRYTLKKKAEYGGASMTYENSYNKSVKEINSIALQHETIAENLKQTVIDPTTKQIQDLKKAKAHYQTEYNKMEKILNRSVSALETSLKRYRTAHMDMIKADEAYKAAEENRNLARVEVDRQKQYAETKRRESEAIKLDYASQLEQTNKIRSDYFQVSLPRLLNELQRSDKDRTESFCQYLKAVAQSESSVMPTIASCLETIVASANEINWTKDSDAIVDALRSGYPIPDELPFVDLDTLPSTSSSDSLNINISANAGTVRSKNKERGTFPWFKTKPKDEDNLGPEQKRKKINKAMKETQSQINQEENKKNSMMKLMKTYEKDPQSAQAVQQQINESEQKLATLREEMARLEDSMRQVTGGNGGPPQGPANGQLSGSSSTRTSVVSAGQPATRDNRTTSFSSDRSEDDDEDFPDGEFDPPTPTASTSEVPAIATDAAPKYTGYCTSMYDFAPEDPTGLSMKVNDQFYILQYDSGDGWTLVTNLDNTEQGYVPTNYLQIQHY